MILFEAVTPVGVQDNCPSVPREIELIRRIQSGEKELLPELLSQWHAFLWVPTATATKIG